MQIIIIKNFGKIAKLTPHYISITKSRHQKGDWAWSSHKKSCHSEPPVFSCVMVCSSKPVWANITIINEIYTTSWSLLVFLSSFRWTFGHVSLNTIDQPLDAFRNAVAREAGGGQNHTLPAAYALSIVLKQRLYFSHSHAICKEALNMYLRILFFWERTYRLDLVCWLGLVMEHQ